MERAEKDGDTKAERGIKYDAGSLKGGNKVKDEKPRRWA